MLLFCSHTHYTVTESPYHSYIEPLQASVWIDQIFLWLFYIAGLLLFINVLIVAGNEQIKVRSKKTIVYSFVDWLNRTENAIIFQKFKTYLKNNNILI